MADLLFEIGSEELPARFVGPALDDLERVFKERCAALNVKHGAVRRFGTPRRLALVVEGVVEQTEDVTRDVQGPSVKAAFDEHGAPKVPAIKFAESVKLPVEALRRISTPKGEYLTASVLDKGRAALDLLPEVLDSCVRKIAFAKSMRWGDVEQSFARPVQWLVAMLGEVVIPLTFADVRSGRVTRGHRFLANAPLTIDRPASYEAQLEKAHVIADLAKRRALTAARVEAAAKQAGATVLADAGLLDQVVNLVELPNPVVGTFEARHLDLPPEVLIQEMKSHQRYFSLVDGAGKLLPKFIAVSNTPVKSEALSVKGYERVLRARLTDGRFFFDEDRRTPLFDRVARLGRRTWVAALGSMAEKTDRIRALAVRLAELTGHGEQRATIERAASLCKADLETGMVGEFPELQGVMGREYALHCNEPAEVALAIFEHYLPRNAADALPTADPGALIGLADRLDSIVGLFAIGKKPTGAKDEGGLRRACLAIINLTLQRGYRFSLASAIDHAIALLEPRLKDLKKKTGEAPLTEQVLEFFRGRLESAWREEHRADVVEAVLSVGFDDLVRSQLRLEALTAYVSRPDFAALASTFKRVGNLVDKQAKDVTPAPVDPSKLSDQAEQALFAQFTAVEDLARAAVKADDFGAALAQMVSLKAPVDLFFEKVMVMADDRLVRENRVRLLMAIGALFGAVADFSKLQAEV
jgi:glycyl-tRNA synthetase beta chain